MELCHVNAIAMKPKVSFLRGLTKERDEFLITDGLLVGARATWSSGEYLCPVAEGYESSVDHIGAILGERAVHSNRFADLDGASGPAASNQYRRGGEFHFPVRHVTVFIL